MPYPWAMVALLTALALAGCGGANNTADPAGTGASNGEDPNDPCPGGIDKESHIERDLPRICAYLMACPNPPEEVDTVEECIEGIATISYERTDCWNRCNSRDCRAWLDTDPVCETEDIGDALHHTCAFVNAFCP